MLARNVIRRAINVMRRVIEQEVGKIPENPFRHYAVSESLVWCWPF